MFITNSVFILATIVSITSKVSARALTPYSHEPFQNIQPLRPRADGSSNEACPASFSNPDAASDNSTYEPDAASAPLCKRGGCFSVPNKFNVNLPSLNPKDARARWEEAGAAGVTLRALMDKYVSARTSRLDEDPSSTQQANFENNYETRFPNQPKPDMWVWNAPQIQDAWAQAELPALDFGALWDLVSYVSKPPDVNNKGDKLAVATVTANVAAGVLVSVRSYSLCDRNAPAKRAFSSTLTWNGWRAIARTAAKARNLKYQVRLRVSNDFSNEVMAIAHELYPDKVDHRPRREGSSELLPPYTGHGRWTPGDEAYNYLLAMPNVKTTVNMIADHNPEMDNPYITVIHTFPYVHPLDFDDTQATQEGSLRDGFIIMEYGQMPQQQDTVQTT